MTQALNIAKALIGWGFMFAAIVALVIAPQYVMPCAAISIAGSLVPNA